MVIVNKICFKSKSGEDISNLELPSILKAKFSLFKPYYDEKTKLIFTDIKKVEFEDKNLLGNRLSKIQIEDIKKWAEENNLIITSEYEEL